MTSLCMISIDRYYAIVRPFSPLYRNHKRRIIYLGQAIGCIITFTVSGPCILFLGVYPDERNVCDIINMNISASIYLLFLTFFLFVMPLSIIVANYVRIIRYRVNYVRPGQTVKGNIDDKVRKYKFIRVLITITSIYVLSIWPFFANITGMALTLRSARDVRKLGTGFYLISIISFVSTFAVNVINPFIYFKYDNNINKKLLDTIRHILHRK
ncbi:Melanin-concentrating hormone receptor 2 [Trichoplax sp. H2]|nr:Melanin-concentrating hormone receptor 2 [Trichoplax sp. H2]|eukprot:RDD38416.1 Melanin-concentrating hormone receptor 2 [Trichoplax sp. H2]